MCWCTPEKRTPFCGAPGCEYPKPISATTIMEIPGAGALLDQETAALASIIRLCEAHPVERFPWQGLIAIHRYAMAGLGIPMPVSSVRPKPVWPPAKP